MEQSIFSTIYFLEINSKIHFHYSTEMMIEATICTFIDTEELKIFSRLEWIILEQFVVENDLCLGKYPIHVELLGYNLL